jgi:hypothetical protein
VLGILTDTWKQPSSINKLRLSWILGETQVFPRILKKIGYADVESKERFPHPHSLDDGGEMQEPNTK